MKGILAACGFVAMLLYYLVQVAVAFLGYDYFITFFGAVAVLAMSMLLRFTFPMTLGAFLGALYVLHWPWYVALGFALPGLVLMLLVGGTQGALHLMRRGRSSVVLDR